MSKAPEIVTVAEGTAEHPRHGSADMLELRDGSILMVRMLGYGSDLRQQAGDDAPFDLVRLVSRDGGRTWSEPTILVPRGPGDTAAYCPHLLRLPDGDILFCYEMCHRFVRGEPKCSSGFCSRSRDECTTLEPPTVISSRSSHLCCSHNDLIRTSRGRLVFPVCYMEGTALQDDGKPGVLAPTDTSVAGCFWSDDDGVTWHECKNYVYLPMRGSMEPKIAELEDGRLLMVMRTQLGSVFKSYSSDGGETWSKAQTTGLRSPESCPALKRIPWTGDLLLVWNDSPYDPRFDHYGIRSPLSIAISRDEGETWHKSKDIETDPTWEFTNPAIAFTSRGTVLVAYEASKYNSLVPPGKLGRDRMHLRLAIIELDWLYS